ncbi:C-type lectin domain-containing protein [Maribacter sp. R77961]|uniref:C-type lectin domain-containing protein n=1 Tax=Maribacter sp. R77961 TaxID=3093871 RepID=UPI0037CB5336
MMKKTFPTTLLGIFLLMQVQVTSSQDTFADNFDVRSYSNNDGSVNFSGTWQETGETTNSTAGRIQINNNASNRRLRFTNLDTRFITRSLDLSAYESATLTLDFERTNGDESLTVQLFNGTNFVDVGILSGTGSFTHDLNPNEISANSAIRFIATDGDWDVSDETIFIDNLLFTAQLANQPPTVTATGNQIYCPGSSVPIAESININDPDDTGTTAMYIQISSGYVNGEDVLALTGTHPNITAVWDVAQGKLTLQGPATYSEFEAAILATEFSSSAASPNGTKQFSISAGDANFLPSTQHYYEFVSDPGITWTDAEIAASNRRYFGLQGYLTTLTSQQEADFSGSQSQGSGWIGASDDAVEGEWRWVTGPEAGTQFWSGGVDGTELTFAFWNNNEPNEFPDGPSVPGQENYAHITDNSVGIQGSWNDLPNTGGSDAFAAQGYVVEYGGLNGDPVLNLTAVTSITIDDQGPTWVTLSGALDENFQCNQDVPSLPVCTDLNTTFFNENQFSWGFGLQNNTSAQVDNWEIVITNADYQLDASQLTNPSAFVYTEIDNGNGTYDYTFTGTSPLPPFSQIPGGNIEWPGVNFGFDPSSDGITIFCGTVSFTPPVAIDNCGGNVEVTIVSDTVTRDNGPNDSERVITYQATDENGNVSVPFTKTITVLDTTPPTASGLTDINVFCSANVPAPDVLLITDEADNCEGTPTVSFIKDISDGGANPETITRTYRVGDITGNTFDVFQNIIISNFTIDAQPSNVTSIAGNSVSFSVTASNTDLYQWQVSTDNGGSFTNLTNDADYSGVQTIDLVLSAAAVERTKNGYLYRVLVSNSASTCPPFASNSALLRIGVGTVITNKRITTRVKAN